MPLLEIYLSGYKRSGPAGKITVDAALLTPAAKSAVASGVLSWASIQALDNKVRADRSVAKKYYNEMCANAAKHLLFLLTGLQIAPDKKIISDDPNLRKVRIINFTENAEFVKFSDGMSFPNSEYRAKGKACSLWSLQVDSNFSKFTSSTWFASFGRDKKGKRFEISNEPYFNFFRNVLLQDQTLDFQDKYDLYAIFCILSWARGGSLGGGAGGGSPLLITVPTLDGANFTFPLCPATPPNILTLAMMNASRKNDAIGWAVSSAGPLGFAAAFQPSFYFGNNAFPHC